MSSVHLPRMVPGKFVSFESIHRKTMSDFKNMRNEDNISRRIAYLNQNFNGPTLNLNAPRRKKPTIYRVPSSQKRQILITQFFQKIEGKQDGEIHLAALTRQ